MSFRNLALVLAVGVALAGCGGSKTSSSSTTTQSSASSNGIMTSQSANPSPSTAAQGPMGGMAQNGEPMAPGTIATVPPGLDCGAVRAVWVNTKSHVYHESGDPYYGRTKHGKYMCPAQAKADGYHAAGTRSSHKHHR